MSTSLVSDDGAREVVSRGVGDGPAGGFLQTSSKHRFPWYVRLFFWKQRRRYGEVLEPARLWGRSPKVFAALALLYGALDRRSSPLEPALRSLVEESHAHGDRPLVTGDIQIRKVGNGLSSETSRSWANFIG